MYGERIEQELRTLRSGALRVPELLGSLATSREELAAVLQETSSALATLTSEWDQHVRNQPSADTSTTPAVERGSSAARDAAEPSPLDAFEAAVTSHMISAAAAVFRCHDPCRPLTSTSGPADPGRQAATLSSIVESVRKAAPGLQLVLCNSHGGMNVAPKDACELKLGYADVFCASVGLAGPGRPEILRVALDSFDKAGDMDAWGHSAHQVFRRVSSLAMRALAYFQKRASCWYAERASVAGQATEAAGDGQLPGQGPGSAAPGDSDAQSGCVLHDMLLWLTLYRDLFTRPCCISGKLLAWDYSTQFPTPPVFRNFKCSRRQLVSMASDSSCIQAYHMHEVPEEMLDWCAPAGDIYSA